jgi:predicted permease
MHDLRAAWQRLRRQPGSAAAIALTMALGIGATSAVFSAIDAVLVRPLPYVRGSSVVLIQQHFRLTGQTDVVFSVAEVNDYRRCRQLESLAEFSRWSFVLRGLGEPESVSAGVVSAGFFDTLGVRPAIGRGFRPEDELPGAPGVVILTHGMWTRMFGADPAAIGRSIQLDTRRAEVIGVLPEVPLYPAASDLFVPTTMASYRAGMTDRLRDDRLVRVIARIRDGITIEQLRQEVTALAVDLEHRYPDAYPARLGYTASVVPLRDDLTRAVKPTLWMLAGVVVLALILACANVAALVFARCQRRAREMAIRKALGADGRALARLLFTETLMLALAGAALGVACAAAGRQALVAFAEPLTPLAGDIAINWRAVLFATVLAVSVSAVATAVSLASLNADAAGALGDGGERVITTRRERWTSRVLVAAQVAVAVILLVAAGTLIRSVIALTRVDPGFRGDRVTTARISWSPGQTRSRAAIVDGARALITRLNEHPQVESASMAGTYPLNPRPLIHQPFDVDGRPVLPGQPRLQADVHYVAPRYFATLRMHLASGRDFTPADGLEGERVAIVNRSLEGRLWGPDSAVDRALRMGTTSRRIVGVIDDIRQRLTQDAADEIYIPYFQTPVGSTAIIRTRDDGSEAVPILRTALRHIDPNAAIADVRTLDDARSDELQSPRHTMLLVSICSVLALAIAAIGTASMLALSLAGRLPEIAVRLALGASPGRIHRMIVGEGLLPTALGVVVGLPTGLALVRTAQHLFFEVKADPVILGITVATALVIVAAASSIPAMRAAGVDPVVVLRRER